MSNSSVTLTQLTLIAALAGISFPGSTLATEASESRAHGSPNQPETAIAVAKSNSLVKNSEFLPLSLLHESMWERLRAEFEFSHIDNKRVDKQVKFLRSGLRSLRSNLIDAGPYLFHIVEQLERADVPLDIALLPLIESAFNPMALSSQSAVGIWQFIPSTANHYGLSTGKHYDQRKDVMASTTAAIRYLKDLHSMFDGDWLLALAAYNTGPGNVRSAMRKALKRGRDPVYWNLKLSRETSNYVPRLIAATKMISQPQKYGLTLPALANRKQIESVAIGRRISLTQIADLTDVSIEKITALNIGLHQGLTPPDGPHTLTLPVEATQPLLRELKKLKRQPLVSNQTHLAMVSREVSDAFVIDSDLHDTVADSDGNSYRPFKTYEYKTHVVQPGDSLWKISRQLNVDVETLRAWNNLHEGQKSIQAGDKLRVATLDVENINPDDVKLMNYRVQATDTLITIADKFELHIGEIKKWNKSLWQKDYVQAGQTLRIPTKIP